MPTIAFDNNKGNWKSTYSFQTTCFSNVEDSFVSYRELAPFQSPGFRTIIYRHTENSGKNTWYGGTAAASVIGVTFNDYVSFNKIFKTISIEGGNMNDQGGTVNTFIANTDSMVNKTSFIGPVTERGGIYYGSINPTIINSQSNVEVLGVLESYEVVNNYINIRYSGSNGSSLTSDSKIFFIDTEEQEVLYSAGAIFASTSPMTTALQTDYGSFNSQIFPIQNDFVYQGGLLLQGVTALFFTGIFQKIQDGKILVGHMSRSTVNGASQKGQYAEALFSIPANPSFEIYGFNLNYEPTDLDHGK